MIIIIILVNKITSGKPEVFLYYFLNFFRLRTVVFFLWLARPVLGPSRLCFCAKYGEAEVFRLTAKGEQRKQAGYDLADGADGNIKGLRRWLRRKEKFSNGRNQNVQ